MTSYNRLFLDIENFYQLDDSYTNVNGIWLNPLEYAVVHNGTTLGLQTLSLSGVEYEEVAFADLDLLTNVGKYTVDPTTNSIILIVLKATIDTVEKAKNSILGILAVYQMKSLEYFSTDALYTMETYSADGTFIGSSLASSTSVLVSKMLTLDTYQNVNSEGGYYYHKLRRALQVSA
jgi:hypothetical protein